MRKKRKKNQSPDDEKRKLSNEGRSLNEMVKKGKI